MSWLSQPPVLCAMVLQEENYVRRFLYGKNGLTDLLSSVLADDGLYFEMASGYMRLAAEILLELCVAAQNYDIPYKNFVVPGCFDESVILSPWANRDKWSEDGKPFLGMSFHRFQKNTNPTRSVKLYLDALFSCLTEEGNLFYCNDGNEQNFNTIFDKAYYLYQDASYQNVIKEGGRDLLYGKGNIFVNLKPEIKTFLAKGAGYAILRTGTGDKKMQTVVKYGEHGGYHGHFDRMSLLSVIKGNKTFYNTEYAWYGYESFLFKMWVQTSVAHNMVTVDLKMQEPTHCDCVMFEKKIIIKQFVFKLRLDGAIHLMVVRHHI